MFSSSPFSLVPSSTITVFSPPNSFFDHEKDELHFNNPQRLHNDILFHAYNSPPVTVTQNHVTTLKQNIVVLQQQQQQQFSEGSGLLDCEDHDDLLDSVISPYKKKFATSEKDGHSKIYTARGPRDRRVRLSIEIARKFFCLQDLLGFDKASKTLDWLLTKSHIAIKDLVEETNHCSSSTLTCQSKVRFLETMKGDLAEENCQKKKSVVKMVGGKRKKATQRCKDRSQENFSRDQSRAEARARARERTKEKMRVKKLNDDLKTFSDGCESGCWGQIETQSDYRNNRCELVKYQETLQQSKDSSFQNKFRAFQTGTSKE